MGSGYLTLNWIIWSWTIATCLTTAISKKALCVRFIELIILYSEELDKEIERKKLEK